MKAPAIAGLIYTLLLLAPPAWAQPPPPPAGEDGGFDIWEYLDMELVALVSSGGSFTRSATKVEVSWNQSFGRSSLTAGVEFLDKSAAVEAELTPRLQEQCAGNRDLLDEDEKELCDEPTRTLDLDVEGRLRLSELYFNWVPRDGLEVGVGLSPLSWGQFLLLSPVNFMLPQNLGADLGLSRGTLQYAQPHLSLRWTPTDRLELGVYHFTRVEIDPILAVVDAALFNADSETKVSERQAYNWLADKTQTAIRVLYRPDWGALGVTYLDGVNHFFEAYRPESLVRLSTMEMVGDKEVTAYRYEDCPGPRARSPFTAGHPGCFDDHNPEQGGYQGELPDSTYLGLEISYGLGGGWTLLAEWVRIHSLENPFPTLRLDGPIYAKAVYVGEGEYGYDEGAMQDPDDRDKRLSTRSLVMDSDGTPNDNFLRGPGDALDRAACDFNEALIGGPARNCGSLRDEDYIMETTETDTQRSRLALGDTEFRSTLNAISIGVEKLSTEEVGWSYSLQLVYLAESFDDPRHGPLQRLYAAADEEFEEFGFVVPGFYAIYSHQFFDRPGQLVLGTGFFASFAGFVGLWNLEVTDNLSAQLGLELVTRASDEQRAEAEDGYAVGEGLAPAVSFGLSLSF